MDIGQFVANRRKKLGYSQSDLAAYLCYSDTAISKFEAGLSSPPMSLVPALANFLQVSVDDLVKKNPNPAPLKVLNPPFDAENCIQNLAALRISRHLKQSEECEILGISKRTVINYEKGTSLPSLNVLDTLLKYYQVSCRAFFYEKLCPDIQNSASFKMRRSQKTVFTFLVGLFVGGGLLTSILVPSMKYASGNNSASSGPLIIPNSTASSAETSSSASSEASGVSPYLPGLKDLTVIVYSGQAGSFTVKPGDVLNLTVFSASYTFSTDSSFAYQLAYYLTSEAPSGTALTRISPYPMVQLSIPSDASTFLDVFSVGVYAYSSSHPNQADGFTGRPLEITVSK
jgi:transcriptional regulator with XRE-family HTH domain